jgi:hypothetical protein
MKPKLRSASSTRISASGSAATVFMERMIAGA